KKGGKTENRKGKKKHQKKEKSQLLSTSYFNPKNPEIGKTQKRKRKKKHQKKEKSQLLSTSYFNPKNPEIGKTQKRKSPEVQVFTLLQPKLQNRKEEIIKLKPSLIPSSCQNLQKQSEHIHFFKLQASSFLYLFSPFIYLHHKYSWLSTFIYLNIVC
ncbi:hypothetical protein LINPERHAP1_LOCUS32499, partial [Linum perenne]